MSAFDFSIKVYYSKWVVSQIALIRHSKLQVHQGIDLDWLMILQSCQPLFVRKTGSVMSQESISSFLPPYILLKFRPSLPLAHKKAFSPPSPPTSHTHTHTHTDTHTALLFTLTFKSNHLLPWWFNGRECACQCSRHELDPWVRKIPWRRKWQPTPVYLPGKSLGKRRLAGYCPWGHKRVRHDLVIKQQTTIFLALSLLPSSHQGPHHITKLISQTHPMVTMS